MGNYNGETNSSSRKEEVKKRIMFNKDEDYYFITYNILILLRTLDCNSSKNKWSDYTKLIYLAPYVANATLTKSLIIFLNGKQPNNFEQDQLRETYIKSKLRLGVISNILVALERNDLVIMEKNKKRHTIDIWLNKEKFKDSFLNSNLFSLEVNNATELKSAIQRLRYISSKTLLEKMYSENGVSIWEG